MAVIFPSALRSLSGRNFRLFFCAQLVSLIGDRMQQMALSWLIFEMTGSSFLLGVTLFLSQIPSLIFPPFVGVVTDRRDKRKILFITQSFSMIQAFLLAALALTGTLAVWSIMALSFFLGLSLAVDRPTRQAFLSEMIEDPQHLSNAIALNSITFNSARLIGPALAGILLTFLSAGVCFLLDGISFLPVLAALAAMRLPSRSRKRGSMRDDMREGIRYILRFSPLRNILLLLSLSSVAVSSFFVFLPEYTSAVWRGDAQLLGWLSSSMGVGSILAAFFLATRRTVLGHGLWIGGGLSLMGLGLLLLPFAPSIPAAVVLLLLSGFGMVAHIAAGNTVIQTIVDVDKRGRVMGFYSVAVVGFMPMGSLLNGWLGENFGLMTAFVLMGLLSLLTGLSFLAWIPQLHRHVRPIYIKLKILPSESEV